MGTASVCLVTVLLALTAASPQDGPTEATSAPPKLQPAPETVDFGLVDPYAPLKRIVQVYNNGPDPVTLKGVQSTCQCTLAALRQYEIAPGASVPVEISLALSDHNSDSVNTRVVVVTSDPRVSLSEVNVLADIAPEYAVEPAQIDLGKVKRNADARAEVRLRQTGRTAVHIKNVEVPPEWVASFEPAAPGEYTVHVRLKPNVALGPHSGKLVIVTDVTRRPRLEIPLRAETVGLECVVTPKVVVFGPVAPGASAGTIELKGGAPLTLGEVVCPPRTFNWRSESLEGGRCVRIILTIAPDAQAGDLVGKIGVVLKDGGTAETREVPFFGTVTK